MPEMADCRKLPRLGRPWITDRITVSYRDRYTASDSGTVRNTNGARTARDDAGYAIERLHRERPDLYAEVLAKRLSPHTAMIEAGFRAKRVALRTDNPDAVSAFLAKHFDAAEIMKIAELAVHIREGGE